MFNDIDKKLKTLAMTLFGVGIVASILALIFFAAEINPLLGGLVFLFGVMISAAVAYALYGFGTVIEKLDNIESVICDEEYGDADETPSAVNNPGDYNVID